MSAAWWAFVGGIVIGVTLGVVGWAWLTAEMQRASAVIEHESDLRRSA